VLIVVSQSRSMEERFKNSLLGSDYSVGDISSNADSLLASFIDFTKSNDDKVKVDQFGKQRLTRIIKGRSTAKKPWISMFEGVTSYPFNVTYVDFDRDELVEGIFLHAVDLSKLSEDDRMLYLKRASVETVSGSSMRHRNTIMMLRALYGSTCRTSKIWGMFKYYIEQLNVDEPLFEEKSMRKIKITCNDGMVGTRIMLFENAILMTYARPDMAEIIAEVVRYQFQDPFFLAAEFKSMIGIFKMNAYALSKGGEQLDVSTNDNWDDIQIFETRACHIRGNDAWYYQRQRDNLIEAETKMRESGLDLTADFCVQMITADVNVQTLRQQVMLYALNALTGFTRTNIPPSHIKNSTPVYPDEHPITAGEYIMNEAEEAFKYAENEGYLPTLETFTRDVYSNLKNTSAGGYKTTRTLFLSNPTGHLRAGENKDGVNVIKLTATQKPLVMLSNPEYFMDYNNLVPYDEQHPMRAGVRYVTDGKRGRLIHMDRLGPNIFGRVLSIPYTRYHNDTYDSSRRLRPLTNPYDVPWCYTAGKETGDLKTDHRFGLLASTRSDIICEGSDYDAFDTNSQEWNARRFQIAGVKRVTDRLGLFTQNATYSDLVDKLWGPGYSSDIYVKSVGPISEAVYKYDGLPSGS